MAPNAAENLQGWRAIYTEATRIMAPGITSLPSSLPISRRKEMKSQCSPYSASGAISPPHAVVSLRVKDAHLSPRWASHTRG